MDYVLFLKIIWSFDIVIKKALDIGGSLTKVCVYLPDNQLLSLPSNLKALLFSSPYQTPKVNEEYISPNPRNKKTSQGQNSANNTIGIQGKNLEPFFDKHSKQKEKEKEKEEVHSLKKFINYFKPELTLELEKETRLGGETIIYGTLFFFIFQTREIELVIELLKGN